MIDIPFEYRRFISGPKIAQAPNRLRGGLSLDEWVAASRSKRRRVMAGVLEAQAKRERQSKQGHKAANQLSASVANASSASNNTISGSVAGTKRQINKRAKIYAVMERCARCGIGIESNRRHVKPRVTFCGKRCQLRRR